MCLYSPFGLYFFISVLFWDIMVYQRSLWHFIFMIVGSFDFILSIPISSWFWSFEMIDNACIFIVDVRVLIVSNINVMDSSNDKKNVLYWCCKKKSVWPYFWMILLTLMFPICILMWALQWTPHASFLIL